MQNSKEIERLPKQLKKVEGELEKQRNNVAKYSIEAPTSQKRWKAERNWDYYGLQKHNITQKLQELGYIK